MKKKKNKADNQAFSFTHNCWCIGLGRMFCALPLSPWYAVEVLTFLAIATATATESPS
jgi:hypothetical protein